MMGAIRDAARGAALLARALRAWIVEPRLMLLGMIPGLIAAALLVAAVVGIAVASGPVAEWAAARVAEDGAWHALVAGIVRVAMIGSSVLISLVAFTAVTMMIGQPFYERIAASVDERLGGVAAVPEEPWWRTTARGARDGALLVVATTGVAIACFLVGLIPVVGTAVSTVAGLLIGGWFLALELTAYPMARRGIVTLRERRRLLATRRPLAIGFGAAVALVCLVPLGAVAIMPVAVVGGALVVREARSESVAVARERATGADQAG